MKKKICVVCTKKKGSRVCRVRNNEIICPVCCVKSRNGDCESCLYYVAAKEYAASKGKKPKVKHFIAESNPEIKESVNQALALAEEGDIEKGEAIISELKKERPRNHMVYYGLGVVHVFKEQLDEAIEYFDKAIDIFPYFTEAHFNKGVAYQKKMDVGNAIRAFKEVVAIGNPKDSIVKQAQDFITGVAQTVRKTEGIDLETYLEAEERFKEAFSYIEKQEWKKAIEKFKASLNKNKRHAQSYSNMGLCYAYLGQKEQALAAFDKALEIDPNYEPASINRIAVESLKEGENLERAEFQSVEYYKDYPLKKRSLTQSILQKLLSKKV